MKFPIPVAVSFAYFPTSNEPVIVGVELGPALGAELGPAVGAAELGPELGAVALQAEHPAPPDTQLGHAGQMGGIILVFNI
jgi:hypothetical protein